MSRIKGENITEVGAGARGRPSSFGQYDQILLNTLKRFVCFIVCPKCYFPTEVPVKMEEKEDILSIFSLNFM